MAGRHPMPQQLVLLLALAACLAAAAAAGKGGDKPRAAVFELIRQEQPSWAEMACNDRQRMAFISSRGRRRAAETGGAEKHRAKAAAAPGPAAEAFAMPMSSGAYTGTGQYFVRFRVGTPAQPFLLVADTGSDLTWVKCRSTPAADSYGYGAPASNDSYSYSSPAPALQGRVFRPEESRTWAPIPCSSDTCVASLPFSLAACPTPGSPCAYDYRYKDGSAARGAVGTDSATIALSGRGGAAPAAASATRKKEQQRQKQKQAKAKLRGVVLGCTTSYNGDSFVASDGVLSLGYSNISFASRAAGRFGGRFSYCLVDHLAPRNATSYLTFGPNPALSPPPPAASKPAKPACAGSHPPAPAPAPAALPGARQTPLLLDHRMRPFYAVTVNGISVDGELLKIPRRVWDIQKGGGAILDSGTSLTVLVSPAYRAVVAALSEKLAGLPRVAMDPFEYCYNWTSPETGEDMAVAVPELALHLAGSARLQPPAKSYVIDAAPGVKCIGVQEGEWPGVSVIGNILQQEHLWEFDIKNRRLRFMRSRCTQ